MKGVPHEARAGRPVRQAGGRAGSEGGKADRTEHRYGDGGGDGDRGYRRHQGKAIAMRRRITVTAIIKAR